MKKMSLLELRSLFNSNSLIVIECKSLCLELECKKTEHVIK